MTKNECLINYDQEPIVDRLQELETTSAWDPSKGNNIITGAADKKFVQSKDNLFSLELSNCTAADNGQYTCRVTASGGETAT